MARVAALYALHCYLPASRVSRRLRQASRRLRGKPVAATRLTTVEWDRVLEHRGIRLVETAKRHGNVNRAELAILAQAAANAAPDSEIIEIGTFDGRTTLNFAVNAPARSAVLTLDLPADHATAYALEQSEQPLVDKPASGDRLRSCRPAWRERAGLVRQMFGDSATFDWSKHYGGASVVFVDGSHSYDYARADSETALRLVKSRGFVLWHDYGVWPGVTRALEELEATRKLGLRQIRGTSLVIWRAPEMVKYVPDAPAGHGDVDEIHVAPTRAPVEPSAGPISAEGQV